MPRVHTDALVLLYRQLGGIQKDPTLRSGSWDLTVADIDGSVIVIELDEELHFNRYREQTLGGPWYDNIAWSPEYSALCKQHERRCLQAGTWGKRWTTPSCERLFGQGGPAGHVGSSAPCTTPSRTSPRSPATGPDSHACPSTISSTAANLRLNSNGLPRAIRRRSGSWSSDE
jgi:hypothetical protein